MKPGIVPHLGRETDEEARENLVEIDDALALGARSESLDEGRDALFHEAIHASPFSYDLLPFRRAGQPLGQLIQDLAMALELVQ